MGTTRKKSLFGTDGVRGEANQWPIRPDVILRLAMAAAPHFLRGDHRHTVVIGKDTRLSGYMVESALTAGFVSMGMEVMLLGPIPTPAVAMLTRSLRADLGVMISASHNLFQDNGIKFFDPSGFKLTDAQEKSLTSEIQKDVPSLPNAAQIAKAYRLDDAGGRYIEFVKATFPKNLRLDGLKIVLDCANGAAYKVAPRILWELGAEVIALYASPDGHNINAACGATAPHALQHAVLEHKAHLGIALDGDADRLILVDENGKIIDGDQLLGLIATSWHQSGLLKGGGVVGTVMSNLGLERHMRAEGLSLVRSAVGDRYVLEAMQAGPYNVGGEQSGHLILLDHNTTGDGLVAALQVLAVLVSQNRPASDIHNLFERYPQVLKSVSVCREFSLKESSIQCLIQDAEQDLQKIQGRLLVRPSGTEPLIRVMAEGEDAVLVEKIVDHLANEIRTLAENLSTAE